MTVMQTISSVVPRDYKALIFDVDGTLAETEEAHRDAFNRAFADWRLGWEWSMADYRELLRTTGGKERIAAYQAGLPALARRLDMDEIRALHAAKTAYYSDILARGDLALRPGVRGLIDRARNAGVRIAVATTTSAPNVDALCQCCWGVPAGEVFEVIASGDQVADKKPAPDIYHLALQKLGMSASDCLAFEDSGHGITAARACGLDVIVTPSIYTDGDDLSAASWRYESLDESRGLFPEVGL